MANPGAPTLWADGCEPPASFMAPWEARAFALAFALAEAGWFTWAEFRARLIAAIRQSDAAVATGRPATPYYESWMIALEGAILAHTPVTAAELAAQAADIAAHPPTPIVAVTRQPVKIA